MRLTTAKKTMTPVQKLGILIDEYFKSEEKFNQTQSEHWLKMKNTKRELIKSFIKTTREEELESRQLTLKF